MRGAPAPVVPPAGRGQGAAAGAGSAQPEEGSSSPRAATGCPGLAGRGRAKVGSEEDAGEEFKAGEGGVGRDRREEFRERAPGKGSSGERCGGGSAAAGRAPGGASPLACAGCSPRRHFSGAPVAAPGGRAGCPAACPGGCRRGGAGGREPGPAPRRGGSRPCPAAGDRCALLGGSGPAARPGSSGPELFSPREAWAGSRFCFDPFFFLFF